VCAECGAQVFQLWRSAEPLSQEVRRLAGAALKQALLAHWQRCGGAVFAGVDVHAEPFSWWPLDPFDLPGDTQELQPQGGTNMSDEQDHHLDITPEALQTIAAMHDRANAIGLEYGKGSPEHLVALESLVTVYGHMLRLGGRIKREGLGEELCLIGVNRFLTYGVIFRPKKLDGDQRDPLLGEWELHS
jgi:hypothetical protein